jgi:hypothetical protein
MSTNCSTVTACLLRENIIVFLFLNGPHNWMLNQSQT